MSHLRSTIYVHNTHDKLDVAAPPHLALGGRGSHGVDLRFVLWDFRRQTFLLPIISHIPKFLLGIAGFVDIRCLEYVIILLVTNFFK